MSVDFLLPDATCIEDNEDTNLCGMCIRTLDSIALLDDAYWIKTINCGMLNKNFRYDAYCCVLILLVAAFC